MALGDKYAGAIQAAIKARAAPPPPAAASLTAPPPAAPAAQPPPVTATLEHSAVNPVTFDRTGLNAQYDAQRQSARQTESGQTSMQRDALERRVAQLGGGPSGALIKQQGMIADQSAQRLQDANRNIDAAQSAEMAKLSQAETQLNAQREDAAAGRDLQKYSTDTSAIAQRYGVDTQKGQFEKTFENTVGQQKFENEANQKTNVLNAVLSMKNSGFNPTQISGLLSSLGLDKLGVDINSIPGLTEAAAPASTDASRQALIDQANARLQASYNIGHADTNRPAYSPLPGYNSRS